MRLQGPHRSEKRRLRDLLTIAADVTNVASSSSLFGVADVDHFEPALIDIPYLRIDQLNAVTAVSKPFERTLQPAPIDLRFVRETVDLVEVIITNRQILGNSPQVVLPLREIPGTGFGRFP